MKDVYSVNPFLIGGQTKSIAIIIPIQVARAFNITNSSILALKANPDSKEITIRQLTAFGEIQK
jgi:hypothetical protein